MLGRLRKNQSVCRKNAIMCQGRGSMDVVKRGTVDCKVHAPPIGMRDLGIRASNGTLSLQPASGN